MWGSISGFVLDQTGAAQVNCRVELTSDDFHFDHRDTDVSGFFSFETLTPGEYTLTIRKDCYHPVVFKRIVAVENVAQYILQVDPNAALRPAKELDASSSQASL